MKTPRDDLETTLNVVPDDMEVEFEWHEIVVIAIAALSLAYVLVEALTG